MLWYYSVWCLTAHSLCYRTMGKFYVRLGVHDRTATENGTVIITAAALVKHPDNDGAKFDFALVKLAMAANISDQVRHGLGMRLEEPKLWRMKCQCENRPGYQTISLRLQNWACRSSYCISVCYKWNNFVGFISRFIDKAASAGNQMHMHQIGIVCTLT